MGENLPLPRPPSPLASSPLSPGVEFSYSNEVLRMEEEAWETKLGLNKSDTIYFKIIVAYFSLSIYIYILHIYIYTHQFPPSTRVEILPQSYFCHYGTTLETTWLLAEIPCKNSMWVLKEINVTVSCKNSNQVIKTSWLINEYIVTNRYVFDTKFAQRT